MRGFFASAIKSALVALFLSLLSFWSVASGQAMDQTFETEQLTIRTAAGKVHVFTVEIARTGDQRAQGLMNRREMADDAGMIFDFGITRPVAMWMKNTYIPLDMLFILPDGAIANIAADTTPHSEAIVESREPVRFVLELNAGRAKALGIAVGDTVESDTISGADANP